MCRSLIFGIYRIETCLCQNDASCQTCRLIKRVKNAEFAQYEAECRRDAALADLDTLQVEVARWKEVFNAEDEEVEDEEFERIEDEDEDVEESEDDEFKEINTN